MPQSLAKILIHLVYSTKDREPWLADDGVRQQLYAYKAAILRDNVDSPALAIGSVDDHIHILLALSRKFAVMKVVEEAKTETTKWIKKQGVQYAGFHWQNGYGAFSVSESNVAQVEAYVRNQAEHHARHTFQDEFRELCRRHGLVVDERYVWE